MEILKFANKGFKFMILLFYIFCTAFSVKAQSRLLKAGDLAPSISDVKWIKGEPVTSFEKGKIYVLEFWATWCGPCRMAMPHLSKLANMYAGKAEVLSFNVNELAYHKAKGLDPIPKVEQFVKRLGNGMDYAVAVELTQKSLWNRWIVATGIPAIPQAFIIGRDGKIAWIGHPYFLEEPLELIVNDQFDEHGRQKMAAEGKLTDERYQVLFAAYKQAQAAKDLQKCLELVDQILIVAPIVRNNFLLKKYDILVSTDPVLAHSLGIQLLSDFEKDPINSLSLSSSILLDTLSAAPDYSLALSLAQQAAMRCEPDDRSALSTLAKAYFKTGNLAKAVEMQRNVVKAVENNVFINYGQEIKEEERKNLKMYISLQKTVDKELQR